MEPKTRKEKYLAAIAGEYEGELPEPKTPTEYFLHAKATAEDEQVNGNVQ